GIPSQIFAGTFPKHWIANFGAIAERGSEFQSALSRELTRLLAGEHSQTIAYQPAANEIAERLHERFKASLIAQPIQSWTKRFPRNLLTIRSVLKEDTHCSTAELIYGMKLRLASDHLNQDTSAAVDLIIYIRRLNSHAQALRDISTQSHAWPTQQRLVDLRSCLHLDCRLRRTACLFDTSLIQRVFQQLTRHRHYDWLRTCLEKSDHADQLPPDYFVTPQPVYRSLGSGDVLQCDRNPCLSFRHDFVKDCAHQNRFRRNSDNYLSAIESVSVPRHVRVADNGYTQTVVPPLSRCDSGSLNRMLTSMYMDHFGRRSFRMSKFRLRNNNGLHTLSTSTSDTKPPDTRGAASVEHLNETDPMSPTRLAVPEFIARIQAIGSIGLCAEFESLLKARPVRGSCDRFM
ncbi:hypothetical protein AHF37_06643, partial [Paragonimus kellicotti]